MELRCIISVTALINGHVALIYESCSVRTSIILCGVKVPWWAAQRRFRLILIIFIRLNPLLDARVAADCLEIRIIEYLSVAYVDFSLALVRHH